MEVYIGETITFHQLPPAAAYIDKPGSGKKLYASTNFAKLDIHTSQGSQPWPEKAVRVSDRACLVCPACPWCRQAKARLAPAGDWLVPAPVTTNQVGPEQRAAPAS